MATLQQMQRAPVAAAGWELPPYSDALLRQDLAALETGYRIGRHMVLREVTGSAPKGFSAVTKTWCTEFEQRVAELEAALKKAPREKKKSKKA
jgi:hypothetical protein